MAIDDLIIQFTDALSDTGATRLFEDWSTFDAATDEELQALSTEVGAPLSEDLKTWLKTVTMALPLDGNYSAVSVQDIIERTKSTKSIDFSQHHKNITSWADGRFDEEIFANTYWQPQWVPIARDGCGNEYCVDLAPGPNGRVGQLIAMEFQDGQGPYLARWSSLEEMLEFHIKKLKAKGYSVDDEGYFEFDYT